MSRLGLGLVDEISSDLRPPLTVVKGCVETVLSNWDALHAREREELLTAALRGADELVASMTALEARLAAVEDALGTGRAGAPIALDEED
jgi:K+-sensing histidine kinase KdpD